MTSRWHDRPLLAALIAQGGGLVLALLIRTLAGSAWPDTLLALAVLQGLLAAALSRLLNAPWWWMPIHLIFLPTAIGATHLGLSPWWYLGGFVLLLLVFGRTDRSRVPLYLSNRVTAQAVEALLPQSAARMIDLGCGDAGLLRTIARARPDCEFVGIEHAPLTYAWAKLRTFGQRNLQIRYGDLWRCDLGPFDLVYAFLSPVPMPKLWIKACEELAPGALLVSNSFEIPGCAPEQTVTLDDRRRTRLLCYRPAKPNAKRRPARAS